MIEIGGPLRKLAGAPAGIVSVASVLQARTHTLKVYAVLFQALPDNAGRVFIGGPHLNRDTLEDVAAVLAIPTPNTIPSFGISLTLSPAGINLIDLYMDADNTNDGVLVTVLVM